MLVFVSKTNRLNYLVNQSVMGKTNTFKGENVKSQSQFNKIKCYLTTNVYLLVYYVNLLRLK